MYLYQPCLLALSLHTWAFDTADRTKRWLMILLPLMLLAVSERELVYPRIIVYPSAMLLPVCFLLRRIQTVSWAEVLTASLTGGFLCWKAADRWPLFPVIIPVCAALMLIPIMVLCGSREDRLLACALGSLIFELFLCLKEYVLFSFCVVRLGSRDALSLGTAALCLHGMVEPFFHFLVSKKKHALSVSN